MARRRSNQTIEVVEVAYRTACVEPAQWLERVIETASGILDLGADVFAYEYDTRRPYAEWLERLLVARGDPRLATELPPAFVATPRDLNERIHKRAGAVTILSELIGQTASEHEQIGPHARNVEMRDMLGINAGDPSGRGAYFCATARTRITRDPARVRRLEHLGAHLAAAGRLRRALASRPLPEAVLTPDGKILHAEGATKSSLPALERAARLIDRARVRSRATDPEALESWRALVEGRWSLVDVIERDGKRFLFAHPNAPSAADPRKLTAMERVIAGYVAMGHSNKLIAYELGLSIGTVSGYVHDILDKFGVRTRVELVDRYAMLTAGETCEVAVADERLAVVVARDAAVDACLTNAERAVATLAARGLSTAAIAQARGTAHRTIANQLAAIFRKLGISSRSELRLQLQRDDGRDPTN